MKFEDITVILSTHYLEEADQFCDRVAIIDRGTIVAMDTPHHLKDELGGDTIVSTRDSDRFYSSIKASGLVKTTADPLLKDIDPGKKEGLILRAGRRSPDRIFALLPVCMSFILHVVHAFCVSLYCRYSRDICGFSRPL